MTWVLCSYCHEAKCDLGVMLTLFSVLVSRRCYSLTIIRFTVTWVLCPQFHLIRCDMGVMPTLLSGSL